MQEEDNDGEDQGEFNMDDFLKEGGIDLDQQDPTAKEEAFKEEELAEPIYTTDPDERMTGWLSYTSQKIEGGNGGETDADLIGMVFSGIGSGLKFGLKAITETIQIKQTRKYFSLKGSHLYWYTHERSREADNTIDLKLTRSIEISTDNSKQFHIIATKKIYRVECEHDKECAKWVNSLKAARDGTFPGGGIDDPNDANRYERLKIYSRITGKSMYSDYDSLLETYEEKVHELIEVKLVEAL